MGDVNTSLDVENDTANSKKGRKNRTKNRGNPNPKPYGRHNHYLNDRGTREDRHYRMERIHGRREAEREAIAKGTKAPPPGAGPNWAKNREATLAKYAKRTKRRHKKHEKKMRNLAKAAAATTKGKKGFPSYDEYQVEDGGHEADEQYEKDGEDNEV